MGLLSKAIGKAVGKAVKVSVEQSKGKFTGIVLAKTAEYTTRAATGIVINKSKIITETEDSFTLTPMASTTIRKMSGLRSERELLSQDPSYYKLILRQRKPTSRRFDIFNENNIKIYMIKRMLLFSKHNFHILGINGEKLGTLKKKLIAFRAPFSKVTNPRDYAVEIKGQSLGKLQTHYKEKKRICQLGSMIWIIESDSLHFNHTIWSDNILIGYISKTDSAPEKGDNYVIDMPDSSNALLSIMLTIAFDDEERFD